MNKLKEFEETNKRHILFLYTNLNKNIDARIDSDLANEFESSIMNLNKYDKLTLIINTSGGNLASGYRIIQLIKNKFKYFEVIVINNCSSTGTLIAFSADKLILKKNACLTPMEPQMDIVEDGYIESISTSVIREYLSNASTHNTIVEKLNPITLGKYYATISYFKKLCYNSLKSNKNLIIDYMLNEISSHQTPLIKTDLDKMNINYEYSESIDNTIIEMHNIILNVLKKKEKNDKKIGRTNVVLTSSSFKVLEKVYDVNNKKISEGYIDVSGEEIMKNKKMVNNKRIRSILEENSKKEKVDYTDAYDDSSNYSDEYSDYSDSVYDDSYSDSYDDSYTDYADSYNSEKPVVKKLGTIKK